jgi:hypothetical protein
MFESFPPQPDTEIDEDGRLLHYIAMLWSALASATHGLTYISGHSDFMPYLDFDDSDHVNESLNVTFMTITGAWTRETRMTNHIMNIDRTDMTPSVQCHGMQNITYLHMTGFYSLLNLDHLVQSFPGLSHAVWSIRSDADKSDVWRWSLDFPAYWQLTTPVSNTSVKVFAFHVVISDYEDGADYTHVVRKWERLLRPLGFPEDRLMVWAGHGDWDLAVDGPQVWAEYLGRIDQLSLQSM